MPGLYLGAIAVSTLGVALLDARWRLVARGRSARWIGCVAVSVVFFVGWDLVGIGTGVFVKGDSPAYLGVQLAPHLPVEELCFLAFLCYLALVVHAAAARALAARAAQRSVSRR